MIAGCSVALRVDLSWYQRQCPAESAELLMMAPLAAGTHYAAQNLHESAVLIYAVLKSNLVCLQQERITGFHGSMVSQADLKTIGKCAQSVVTAHG